MGVYGRNIEIILNGKNMRKNTIIQRLNIIKGQIDGLTNLIEKKENCQKVTEQFYAINVAFKKAVELYLKENLHSCLKSINLKKRKTVNFLLKEILKNK
jgi:DNA-binding FrmR family transcriptional regulator